MGYSFQAEGAATGSVGTASIVDAAVTTAKLALGAVTTDRIADGAVTSAKLASGIVGSTQIADDAIGAQHIAAGAVGSSELADNAVDSAAIQNEAVTSGKIAPDAVGASHIADGSIDATHIAANAVGSSELADNAVDTNAIVNEAVTAAKLAPGAVETAATADGSITVAKLAAAQAFTASGSIVSSGGRLVTFTGASGQTLTLPAATVGLAFEVANIDSSDSFTLDGNGAETVGGVASVTIPAGGRYLVHCTTAGAWHISTLHVPLVSALPAAPFDGMEIRYQSAAMATSGVVWGFRYNASSSSSYKWEGVGQQEALRHEVDAGETTTSTAAGGVELTTPVEVTMPLAGEYVAAYGANAYNSAAQDNVTFVAGHDGGTTGTKAVQSSSSAANLNYTGSRESALTASAASRRFHLRHRTTGGTATFRNRWIAVRPVRVG